MTNDPLLGRQLANFRIERVIGRGGMGQVYYGQDVKLGRPVAIKVIDVRHRGNTAYAERFVREARLIATWRHEHIIQIHYADDEGDLYYFVMEFIDGSDLGEVMSQYVAKDELMPYAEVLRIGRAVARALDYAHKRGVIHRDVKPSNVLVAGDGRVVLTDFGLAMDVAQGSLGEVFGSSHYIAPEQARRSAEAVPQSDLYSLGVMLYELLTGQVPFDDPSPTTVAVQHMTQVPPAPREINPELSLEVEAVLLKALSKSPEERYQSGREFVAALEKALAEPAMDPPSAAPADAETDDLLGRQLDEYRLEALLGQGGMARVYRGLDVRLKRWVAIKVIDTSFRSNPDYIVRFEREAQAIAQLEHPHIVRLYRYGEVDGLFYMAMQYVEGADLASVLASYREDGEYIEPEEARRVVREVCLALDDAHGKGVIHRDVKPSNIMLDKGGRAILTDFGLALMTELGTRGEIFGSPHYIAPEQAMSSANVVPQSDLYAIGIILYEMFTGKVPFEAEEPLDVAMLHLSEPPRPPRELRPELNPELEGVILKTLAKEPQDRYPSGAALAEALDQALQATSRQAPVSPPPAAQMSIPERVAVESAERPLPPIPAAVSTPPFRQAGPQTELAPTVPDPPAAPALEPTIPSPQLLMRQRLTPYLAGLGLLLAICIILAVLWPGRGEDRAAMIEEVPATKAIPAGEEAEITPTETAENGAAQAAGVGTATATRTETPAPTPTAVLTATSTIPPTLVSGQVLSTTTLLAPTLPPASPTPTATPKPPATATPTSPPTATQPPPPTATFTPKPPTPTPKPPTPTPGPTHYELLIAKEGEDSLFVVNQATVAFPLSPLRLGDDKGAIDGPDWAIATLDSGACVTVWKKQGKAKAPKITCVEVGQSLRRDKREIFWSKDFKVYYQEALIGTCKKKAKACTVIIPN